MFWLLGIFGGFASKAGHRPCIGMSYLTDLSKCSDNSFLIPLESMLLIGSSTTVAGIGFLGMYRSISLNRSMMIPPVMNILPQDEPTLTCEKPN
jgi:hypothetical protein